MLQFRTVILVLAVVWGMSRSASADNHCPTFWTAWGDHCYRYFGDEVPWIEAVNACRLLSAPGFADLVSIHSSDEHNFLYSYWRSLRQHDDRRYKPGMWIGLTDVEADGVYKWSDGTDLDYTNFDVSQGSSHQYRWFMWDWADSNFNPQGKWHDKEDVEGWHFQFMCKMARV